MGNQPTISEERQREKPSLNGIFTSPIIQLERIKEKPRILVPLLIVLLGACLGGYIVGMGSESNLVDAGISQEEVLLFGGIGGVVIVGFTTIFSLLFSTIVYLIITKIAGTGATFKQLFSFSTFVSLIGITGVLLNAIIAYFTGADSEAQMTSLNSLINAKGAWGGIFETLEVFVIWGTVLTGIGLHKVGGLSKGAAWTIAILFFMIGLASSAATGYFEGLSFE